MSHLSTHDACWGGHGTRSNEVRSASSKHPRSFPDLAVNCICSLHLVSRRMSPEGTTTCRARRDSSRHGHGTSATHLHAVAPSGENLPGHTSLSPVVASARRKSRARESGTSAMDRMRVA